MAYIAYSLQGCLAQDNSTGMGVGDLLQVVASDWLMDRIVGCFQGVSHILLSGSVKRHQVNRLAADRVQNDRLGLDRIGRT